MTLRQWDYFMVVSCFFAMFWLMLSPFVPYLFNLNDFNPADPGSVPMLFLFSAVTAAPLAAIGVYLNHRVDRAAKAQQTSAAKQQDKAQQERERRKR